MNPIRAVEATSNERKRPILYSIPAGQHTYKAMSPQAPTAIMASNIPASISILFFISIFALIPQYDDILETSLTKDHDSCEHQR